MAEKNNRTRMTKGGSPIIQMEVVANTSGGSYQKRTRNKAAVEARNGVTYLVPVDKDGRVPEDALYEHFLDTGNWSRDGRRRNIKADLTTTAQKLHAPKDRKGWYPEEIVKTGWWAAVNESDIVGVDDSTSCMFASYEDIKPSMRSSIGKIALLMPADRQDYVVKTLQNNFTAAELKRMTADYGLVIVEGNPGRLNDGCYVCRQHGVDTPRICIRSSSGEDTITHEMIHHARASDPERTDISRAPKQFDKDGYLIPGTFDAYHNLEEAATVAESTARTREPTTNLGYYTMLKNGTAQALYDSDRALLTNGKPLKGKRATEKINSSFEETAISDLKFTTGSRPRAAIDELRVQGRIKPSTKKKTTNGTSASKRRSSGAKASGSRSSTKSGGKRR